MEVVDADLEIMILQPLTQLGFNPVRALRYEIKTGAEPQFHLGFREPATVGQPLGPLDVVRQDNGEALPTRPARPPQRWRRCGGIDGPRPRARSQGATRSGPSHCNAETPRQKRL